jgi:hypothetical protein
LPVKTDVTSDNALSGRIKTQIWYLITYVIGKWL